MMHPSVYCDGCACLAYDEAVNRYDVNRALCCDPDKPVLGERRVLAVSGTGWPRNIERPAWCRGKRNAASVAAHRDG